VTEIGPSGDEPSALNPPLPSEHASRTPESPVDPVSCDTTCVDGDAEQAQRRARSKVRGVDDFHSFIFHLGVFRSIGDPDRERYAGRGRPKTSYEQTTPSVRSGWSVDHGEDVCAPGSCDLGRTGLGVGSPPHERGWQGWQGRATREGDGGAVEKSV
jgi:hypothetical protein